MYSAKYERSHFESYPECWNWTRRIYCGHVRYLERNCLQLSRGDSSKIQSVRENMTSCILGLILILFSVLYYELSI